MENVKIGESNYPSREKGYSMDEQKFAKFSQDIFRNVFFGYLIGLYLNIVFFFCWKNKAGIFQILLTLFINYLVIQIILVKMYKTKEEKEEKEEK